MKKTHFIIILTLFSIIFIILSLTPIYASQLKLEEGIILTYKYARISTGSPASTTGNATFQILTLNQTTLLFRINTTETFTYKITYQNGLPIYADRLEALIYLPPESLTQTLQGNLEWTKQIETKTRATIANATSQTISFTVETRTFQSINITLNLVGWEYGTLTLIYDLNSGILIYEQWIPEYGDIIIHTLTTYPIDIWKSLQNLILPAATFATPTAITIHQTQKTLKNRKYKHTLHQAKFKTKTFSILITAALLNLASTIFPWSQLSELQIYLPSSLPSFLIQSTEFLTSTSNFTIISLTAHTAAILAWLSIAIHIYTSKKLTAKLTTTASAILAPVSAILFFQTGWTLLWGPFLAFSSAVMAVISLAFAGIKKRESPPTPPHI
ncbi:MAG: hypothetical protein ACUVUF_07740 [Candidatus Bathycorpusculaceae bacterium]